MLLRILFDHVADICEKARLHEYYALYVSRYLEDPLIQRPARDTSIERPS